MYKLKNFVAEKYESQQSFVVRNPLFPVEKFFNWKDETSNCVEESKSKLCNKLKDFYSNPISKEALYIASPDLHAQLLFWLDDKIENQGKKHKIELSLVKYMARMCTRSTPYGLFASCTTGNFSNTTSIIISKQDSLERHCRLDMDFVCELQAHLSQQKEIASQLKFYPNTSLYRFGDQYRYVERRFDKEEGRTYHLVEVDKTVYLEKIITASKAGLKPNQLASVIIDDAICFAEAKEFIDEVIQSQVLVNELEPAVTGEEYFSILLRKLKTLQHTEKYTELCENIASILTQIKDSASAEKNEMYENVIQLAKYSDVNFKTNNLIQVDTYRPALTCKLNAAIQFEILKGVNLLLHLHSPSMHDSFSDFKTAFINRYENEMISLVEALDTESGISYGKFQVGQMDASPLIDKLPIGNPEKQNQLSQLYRADNLKWQIYLEAISKNKSEIVIDDTIIESLSKKEITAGRLPDSFSVMVKIHSRSANDFDNGNYTIYLQPPSGPSGANLLARFCHLNQEIEDLAKEIVTREEQLYGDSIFAEIAHLPESRIGNVLTRPVLRQYEIPYLCGTTLDKKFQIPVDDLLVFVEDNKVRLHSKTLNKEIIPRMTNAHNFHKTSLPLYQFLCDLQFQEIELPAWNWGILENVPFLPRVSYGRIILSKARWLLNNEDVNGLKEKTEEELMKCFEKLTRDKLLPEYVLLSEGDNELLLHLKNIYCVQLLLSAIKKTESVILTETLDFPKQCWIKADEGSYAGEFIFAFNATDKTCRSKSFALPQPTAIKRIFPVGSEWLYAKIYCGAKTSEKLLGSVIKPFCEELYADQLIDRFFFLRYNDQSHHLRIRFHNSKNKNFWKGIIYRLNQVLAPFFENRLVHNLQFETYKREIDRYGHDTMISSEDIFWHQSSAILNFLTLLEGDEGEEYRWKLGTKALDTLLSDFGYTIEKKRALVGELNKGFSTEFKIDSAIRKKISERYHHHKSSVERLLENRFLPDEYLGISALTMNNPSYRKTIDSILKAPSVVKNPLRLDYLLSSYLHMFINRMFISNQRKVEFMIYEYLVRFYESKLAREQTAKPLIVKAVK
jgi:thiopeptide-type bacteriocin biosynthesis protein